MTKYHALALATEYWKPGEDYLTIIIDNLAEKVRDSDFVVVSEKALSTALGNIIDESTVKA
ncbi:MAG: coenzyme F420-0:L-glutamate ligase, partial [Candidatus Bathyarchaeota archaeon]|nr:coenzyme F420-0:L-glutamate ligase [Candidatus Bathyarchaeota archaeon]